jgi:uncharacterized protein (DUF302 family)
MQNPEGSITAIGRHEAIETLNRLEASIVAHGLTIFARVDHAEGARSVGLELRPTVVVIFGSPKSGTPLMQMSDTVGLDLPLKMLVRVDAEGRTLIAYDDPVWLVSRHGLGAAAHPIVAKMRELLATIAADAAAGAP